MDSIIEPQLRRTNRNLLITNLVILVLLLLMTWAFSRYYYNFSYGPFACSRGDLLSITNPESRKEYFVIIQGDSVFDSGFSHVQRTYDKYTNHLKSEWTTGYYELLLINQKLLIVYTEHPSISINYTGSLDTIPHDLRKEFIDKSESAVKETVLPYMLDATPFRTGGYWGLSLIMLVFLISIWNLQNLFRRFVNPSLHPINKSLQPYGDPVQLAGSIENEFRSLDRCVEFPKCFLTV